VTQGDPLRWRMYPFQGKKLQAEPGFNTLKGIHPPAMGNTRRENGRQTTFEHAKG